MRYRIFAALAVPALAAGLALSAAAGAQAAVRPHPNSVASGTEVTTNNGVAGYYTDNPTGTTENLQWNQVVTADDENMSVGTDGVGGQLCNDSTGQTFGAGIERASTTNAFNIDYAYGNLAADPGAVFDNRADVNPCLGGILPAVAPLTLSTNVAVGDTLHFWLNLHHSTTGAHRWWLKVTVTDATLGDSYSKSIRLPEHVNPAFNQAGIGNEKTLTGLQSPVQPANDLGDFWGISTTPTFSSGFNSFGCGITTTEVNSSATTNPNATEVDPSGSLSGGCGYVYPTFGDYASLSVYTGNQNS